MKLTVWIVLFFTAGAAFAGGFGGVATALYYWPSIDVECDTSKATPALALPEAPVPQQLIPYRYKREAEDAQQAPEACARNLTRIAVKATEAYTPCTTGDAKECYRIQRELEQQASVIDYVCVAL